MRKPNYSEIVSQDEIRSEKLFDKYYLLKNNRNQTGQVKRHKRINKCIKKVMKKLKVVCCHRENMRRLYVEAKDAKLKQLIAAKLKKEKAELSNVDIKELDSELFKLEQELNKLNEEIKQFDEENMQDVDNLQDEDVSLNV